MRGAWASVWVGVSRGPFWPAWQESPVRASRLPRAGRTSRGKLTSKGLRVVNYPQLTPGVPSVRSCGDLEEVAVLRSGSRGPPSRACPCSAASSKEGNITTWAPSNAGAGCGLRGRCPRRRLHVRRLPLKPGPRWHASCRLLALRSPGCVLLVGEPRGIFFRRLVIWARRWG